jgi:phosphate transport system protein
VRETFGRELSGLQEEVLALGSLVETALVDAVAALRRREFDRARSIIAGDREINRRRFSIENDALVLIATQQPMAGDLRNLAAILEIVTELERIGDYAKGIARICTLMADMPPLRPIVDIALMAEKARHMLHLSLDAFVGRDVDLARSIPAMDDEVDELYNQVYRDLIGHIITDPHTIDRATYLLWVAHNLERTADRVINICERVVYAVTGGLAELDSDDSGIESL